MFTMVPPQIPILLEFGKIVEHIQDNYNHYRMERFLLAISQKLCNTPFSDIFTPCRFFVCLKLTTYTDEILVVDNVLVNLIKIQPFKIKLCERRRSSDATPGQEKGELSSPGTC